MDHRAVERTLLVLIWLVEAAGVSSKEDDAFSRDTGSWNSTTVAIRDNSYTTTQQHTNNSGMATTAQMVGNSTDVATATGNSSRPPEVAMAAGNSSNSNETITANTIITTMSSRSTEDAFTSTQSSSSSAAAAAANSSGRDAAPNILASNASEVSFAAEAFTNANTTTIIPNSAATAQLDSNATYATVSNSKNQDYATTTFGPDSYNWTGGTTQGRGGGGGGNGDGVSTGAQVSLRAEDPLQADQGSWNGTTPLSGTSNNSAVQSNVNGNDTMTYTTVSPTSAGPVADTTLTLSTTASNAPNRSNNGNASENLLTSTGSNNTDAKANPGNSSATQLDSNATVTNTQNQDYATTTLGPGSYNSTGGTTQGRGGGGEGGGNVTGVRAALGAENPSSGEPGSWNSTTAISYNGNNTTQQQPGEGLPAAPINSSANNTDTTTTPSNTSATPAPNSTAAAFASTTPPSASYAANSSDAAPSNFTADSALQTASTSSYFAIENTTANSSNSWKTDSGSNAMVNVSEGQMNGTGFGNNSYYNWSSVTTQPVGGFGGGGGGGNWSNSSVPMASNSSAWNQTADMTTVSPYRTVLCYNCSGNNCSETDDSNITTTCVSNTGTCYIQYDAVATALSYSCAPLLAGSNGCPPGDYSTRASGTVCEVCCTASFCNRKSAAEMEQMCRQQVMRSSVGHIGGGRVFQLVVALIAAIRFYCSFGIGSFGDW